ncbi:hypothetical protein ACA910_018675 [Epithemia clementina (nom. ined.)]
MRMEEPFQMFKRGPYPLSDTQGMVPAVLSRRWSLDRGNNSATIQWDTMRGVRSTISSFIHTTPYGSACSTMTDSKRSTFVTCSTTNAIWFKRFMEGTHERMGDVKIQDVALSIDVLLALQELNKQ